jgi:hypothetical protein
VTVEDDGMVGVAIGQDGLFVVMEQKTTLSVTAVALCLEASSLSFV